MYINGINAIKRVFPLQNMHLKLWTFFFHMNLELVNKLRRLERPISEADRNSLLTNLRAYPTGMDHERSTDPTYWKRGSVYFHSLQDTKFASEALSERWPGQHFVKECQACFAKDLETYLKGFPREEAEMKGLFELIFKVGTSAYWEKDQQLLIELDRLYKALDEKVITPWVEQK
jgi:hypothetical protein